EVRSRRDPNFAHRKRPELDVNPRRPHRSEGRTRHGAPDGRGVRRAARRRPRRLERDPLTLQCGAPMTGPDDTIPPDAANDTDPPLLVIPAGFSSFEFSRALDRLHAAMLE